MSRCLIRTIVCSTITIVALAGRSHVVADELLTNGSFETPAIGQINATFYAPSTAITGWTVTENNVDINETSSIFGSAKDGIQMLEVNGTTTGAVQQSFATAIGGTYLLTLYYSNNPNPAFSSPSYSADVSIVGNSTIYDQSVTHGGTDPSNMQWTLLSHQFVADSSTTTLQLTSTIGGYNGIVFDAVSVSTVPVPEPSSLMLAALGGLALLAVKLRRAES